MTRTGRQRRDGVRPSCAEERQWWKERGSVSMAVAVDTKMRCSTQGFETNTYVPNETKQWFVYIIG